LGLALEMSKIFIQNWLHEQSMNHLHVRKQGKSLLIFSFENEEIANRAVLVRFPNNDYSLCVANHRGKWEMVRFVGELPAMLKLLTSRFAFALARWPDERTNRFVT